MTSRDSEQPRYSDSVPYHTLPLHSPLGASFAPVGYFVPFSIFHRAHDNPHELSPELVQTLISGYSSDTCIVFAAT
jgi:hypothetical protein